MSLCHSWRHCQQAPADLALKRQLHNHQLQVRTSGPWQPGFVSQPRLPEFAGVPQGAAAQPAGTPSGNPSLPKSSWPYPPTLPCPISGSQHPHGRLPPNAALQPPASWTPATGHPHPPASPRRHTSVPHQSAGLHLPPHRSSPQPPSGLLVPTHASCQPQPSPSNRSVGGTYCHPASSCLGSGI